MHAKCQTLEKTKRKYNMGEGSGRETGSQSARLDSEG